MPQRCPVAFIYGTLLIWIAGLIFLVARANMWMAFVWLIGVPLCQWAYVRSFPRISAFIGYGRVDDRVPVAEASPRRQPETGPKVKLYTAIGCPFCPIVKERLTALQAQMAFALEEIDVALKPDVMLAQGIWSVPVVEVEGRKLVGHATTEQLAALIRPQLGPA